MVPQFLGFVLFLIAGWPKPGALPFDLPEAESELVAGYHSEYSGMKFGMFFVGEYLGVILISSLISDSLLRRLAGPRAAADCLVSHQDVLLHLFLHSAAGIPAAAALRPVDVVGLESDVAVGAGSTC